MDPDTAIGGAGGRFPATRESFVDSLRSVDEGERRAARERLVTLYWKPLYKYLRIRWGRSNEEAKDLVQGFFTLVLERDSLASFDPAKATFRTFLRVLLDRYAANEDKSLQRLKRGGDLTELDFEAAEHELARVATFASDPDEMLHREWIRSLFALCVERLHTELCGCGREQQFRVFAAYDLDDGPKRPRYRDIASSLGITETTVTNHLSTARRRFREIGPRTDVWALGTILRHLAAAACARDGRALHLRDHAAGGHPRSGRGLGHAALRKGERARCGGLRRWWDALAAGSCATPSRLPRTDTRTLQRTRRHHGGDRQGSGDPDREHREEDGEDLAQWSAEIKSCGKTKHGEIRTWLKESYGLGHGDAKLLAIVQAAFEAAG